MGFVAVSIISLVCALALEGTGKFAASAVTVHVNVAYSGNSSDGTLHKPFASLEGAKKHVIQQVTAGRMREHEPKTVVVHPGVYAPLSIDHPALSSVSWEGVRGGDPPILSGGIQIPRERFKPYSGSGSDNAYVASLEGLPGVTGELDLGAMVSGDPVTDCQHDKVGVSLDGEPLVLARWPNLPDDITAPAAWARASHCSPSGSGFSMDLGEHPEAERLLKWAGERNPYVHGYWQWDWADSYGGVIDVRRVRTRTATRGGRGSDSEGSPGSVYLSYKDAPGCKSGARWMGVNLLCELDAPGEYYLDPVDKLLYVIPPVGKTLDSSLVSLMYQRGGVLNVTSDVRGARVSHLDVRDGRHAGVLAAGAHGVQLEGVVVHAHGTNGIDLSDSPGSVITGSEVHGVGCTGIRATAGDAASLLAGNTRVESNRVHHYALWKRSYQPGIFWGGVNNTFRANSVTFGPHNGFLGGGDFADGVNNLFEENHVADCTFDTIDSGGFYTCGQRGAAFTNRGNVLRNNTFARIRNTAGLGVQVASNQAVYLDDQMSGWLVANNTFTDCQIGVFDGGGRRNLFQGNDFVRCGTVFYLNNQGMPGQFDNPTVNCSEVAAPFETTCSTGAAEWMLTEAPAAAEWAKTWPEMKSIRSDYLGYPAHTQLVDSTYCCASDAQICELVSSNTDVAQAREWQVIVKSNTKTAPC